MDFSKLSPYLLEIACFVGQYFGTKNKYFDDLFNLKPWLMSNQEPSFESMYERKKVVPEYAKEYYTELAYQNMIISLGKTLIQNHELDKFNTFFVS